MSHNRLDEIYAQLANLYLLCRSFDGSLTLGTVTPEMKMEHQKITAQIDALLIEKDQLCEARNEALRS